MLPTAVMERAQQEMLDWNGSGMSVMEMSHRGKEYMSIATKAEKDLREVMSIPDNYKVLFLQGGASAQFAMVPLNLLGDKQSADYINTGIWSKKAIAEAKRYCSVNIVADTSDNGFTTVPTQRTRPSAALSSIIFRTRGMFPLSQICPPPFLKEYRPCRFSHCYYPRGSAG